MKDILISIKPRWAEDILAGRKVVELRRTAPKPNEDEKGLAKDRYVAYICYGGNVVGSANVTGISRCEHIATIFRDKYAKQACVTQEEWEAYQPKYMWMLSRPRRLHEPLPLSSIGVQRAPQSWQYISFYQAGQIEREIF